ncbi:MAG: DUF302 domain-containing protein [Chloroflexi bacterium]|nr:DUF302 domain-containing protein [Chloroflexota bacterium]
MTSRSRTPLTARLSVGFDEAVRKTTDALKTEGFGILTKIDMKQTLKEKLNEEFRRYVILGACNPPLAFQALSASLDVGLLLPCNVIVYEDGEGSVVNILDPFTMAQVLPNDALEPMAQEARSRLERVIEVLTDELPTVNSS